MESIDTILDGVNAKIAAACAKAGRDPAEVEIIAVTKTHGAEVVREAWEGGLRIVGENKVQEAAWKQPMSVSGPEWHLIGHLQRNKVRHALELFECFHSVDSIALLDRIEFLASEMGKRPRVLIEVNVSGERSKDGMKPEDVPAAVEHVLERCPSVTLEGFMTMAPFFPEEKVEETRPFFRRLRELRDAMEERFNASFPRLSMGMSGDYQIAVEEGATWIRLGTVLFGERPKVKLQRSVDAGDAGESGEGGGEFDRIMD
ncbi:MAG: YggS family pyridoxal phosphate-dependent enzyme [Kiritimatiellae bacterium]|nr:YggS family pyridoxal phosphate-dependent enzyme [Kiritimatiellia bacterium]